MTDERDFRVRINFMVLRQIGGGLLSTLRPKEPFLLGTDYATRSDKILTDLEAHRKDVIIALNQLTLADLKVSFSERGEPLTEAWKSWALERRDVIKTKFSNLQGWLSLQFSPDKYPAKFEYWAKSAFFTMDEAVWLSLGLEPLQELNNLLSSGGLKRPEDRAACEFIRAQFTLFRRELDPYSYERTFRAPDILKWITRVDLEVHPRYRLMLQTMTDRDQKGSTNTSEAEVDTAIKPERFEGREKTSLAKLLVAIAITEYGYDPNARRSPIPREIQDIAARLGLDVSQDTIRQYLQLGARHLPPDWKQGE